MAITVTRPDGTIFGPPTVVNDSTGQYHADVLTDAANYGVWQWRYDASGAVLPSVYTGQFFVRTPGQRIVGLKEAKDYLNKNQLKVTDDEELRDFIDMTRMLIENIKGAVVPRTLTEFYDGGRPVITLRKGPVLSVTTVQESWGPGDVRTLTAEPDLSIGAVENQYMLDKVRRFVGRRNGGYHAYFPTGTNNIKVVYVVGTSPIPDNIRLGALELISHMWRASQLQGGGSRPREGQSETVSIAMALAPRVREMLGPRRAPRVGGS